MSPQNASGLATAIHLPPPLLFSASQRREGRGRSITTATSKWFFLLPVQFLTILFLLLSLLLVCGGGLARLRLAEDKFGPYAEGIGVIVIGILQQLPDDTYQETKSAKDSAPGPVEFAMLKRERGLTTGLQKMMPE